jgi:hypothetical protein
MANNSADKIEVLDGRVTEIFKETYGMQTPALAFVPFTEPSV